MKETLKDRISYFIAKHLPKRVLYFALVYIWGLLTTDIYDYLTPTDIDIFMAMEGIERFKYYK